ncbi:Uma2 family endonuclease [Argonema galeatum]|uniref:Uma2 family endonuclease n=1 Tax=Argonema galeatum TaxID=2942762 RepID=UPI002012A3F3|nr:Uma2 family endonuclease [Argonema galeatum]MCL1465187.1 Uma2 family endonuclease [Argonema galeatum A003/A1]
MKWEEVCENKQLQDLPFKIELNKWGQIVMSPAKPKHSAYQGIIISILSSLRETGVAFPECAIQTQENVKVADVVWCSDERLDVILEETAASIAPEICVEVKSASNTLEEMLEKKDLYFAAGAEEVWVCDAQGKMRFYNPQGELSKSLLVPEFPEQIQRRNQPTA